MNTKKSDKITKSFINLLKKYGHKFKVHTRFTSSCNT